ncbi:MAG: alpha/beta fold hydrolase [Balneolaceae bacterium]|nr:alpha/beta fold hydrolase [Balneolaceae bacterium]
MAHHVISRRTGSIPADDGSSITWDLYLPGDRSGRALPVIIFLHGFKGFKDWGPFPDACEAISEAGFAVMAVNFSHNGIGEDPRVFDRLDLFRRETLSRDLDEVDLVIRALKEGDVDAGGRRLNTDAIGLLGHSRGGHTAVAAAAEYEEVACLVTWSAVADYNQRWSEEMIADWEDKGVTEIRNGRTGQMMPVDRVVWDDARENAGRLMAAERVKELHIPVLFVHARGDESVPPADAELLHRNCPSADKKLMLVPGTGHTFGGSHPFGEESFPEPFEKMLGRTAGWFEDHLL